MPTPIESVEAELRARPRRWLVTGAAGFIGSHLTERLLSLGQEVVGLDNFATGYRRNLDAAVAAGGPGAASRFTFIEGDIRDAGGCRQACTGVEYIFHEAALGSVPRSVADPASTHAVNVDGFVNVLLAARDQKVRRFVYASSSSVYGSDPTLPKLEDRIGKPLSPYALSKRVNELYARNYGEVFGIETVGLRYFNVFGPRQDPNGTYAAVIARWIGTMLRREQCVIHGDGETSRDFCFVENVVQANLLAALAPSDSGVVNEVFNVACGETTSLTRLFEHLRERLAEHFPDFSAPPPLYGPFRTGDIRHSLADITKSQDRLGYVPKTSVRDGLHRTVDQYVSVIAQLPKP